MICTSLIEIDIHSLEGWETGRVKSIHKQVLTPEGSSFQSLINNDLSLIKNNTKSLMESREEVLKKFVLMMTMELHRYSWIYSEERYIGCRKIQMKYKNQISRDQMPDIQSERTECAVYAKSRKRLFTSWVSTRTKLSSKMDYKRLYKIRRKQRSMLLQLNYVKYEIWIDIQCW